MPIDESALNRSLEACALPADVENTAEEEWQNFITSKAWENIRHDFSEKMQQSFTMLFQGETRQAIAAKLKIPANTVSVYKKRIQQRMLVEIRRLDRELG